MPPSLLELRPATIEDAPLVADLDTTAEPDNPRDPVMMAFWWRQHMAGEKTQRLVNTENGVARVFVYAGHGSFDGDPTRYGQIRVRVHPEAWSDDLYQHALTLGEAWLRDEGARVAVAKVREGHTRETELLKALGYDEERRQRESSLDLVGGRDRLLATADRTRAEMDLQGIELMTLDRDTDPARFQKLYDLDVETTEDVPKTAPWPVPTFDEWRAHWFENPAHTPERFWIAREGENIVGLSVIGYPPVRGIPWTSFTCTARSVRGRGVARALKYASVKQAIELGARAVATQNDAENAPILHLNEEMGYRPTWTVIELHRGL